MISYFKTMVINMISFPWSLGEGGEVLDLAWPGAVGSRHPVVFGRVDGTTKKNTDMPSLATFFVLLSGNLTFNYGKSQVLMGKLFKMEILFNSYVKLYRRVVLEAPSDLTHFSCLVILGSHPLQQRHHFSREG